MKRQATASLSRDLKALRALVLRHYKKEQRDFPWRPPELKLRANGVVRDPYHVLVSEIMLQQTQAGSRTIEKYRAFLKAFPTTSVLAKATLSQVYALWQGLGYNRRAKALRDAARLIEEAYEGKFPRTIPELLKLPGVGPYTASAVYVFAYNKPAVLIETNIRTVFIHHLFKDRDGVSDAELMPFLDAALDREHPRDWYYALMDYGAMLKKEVGNVSRRSRHYVRQPTFVGSNRQLRGMLLSTLLKRPRQDLAMLARSTGELQARVKLQLQALVKDGLLKAEGGFYSLA